MPCGNLTEGDVLGHVSVVFLYIVTFVAAKCYAFPAHVVSLLFRTMCGCRVRVELSTGEKRSRSRGPPPSWSRRPRDDYRRRSPPVRRRYVFLVFFRRYAFSFEK